MGARGKDGFTQFWSSSSQMERITNWAAGGCTVAEIAQNMGTTAKTLYEWQNKHPELRNAIESGRRMSVQAIENSLYRQATGQAYEEQEVIEECVVGGVRQVRKRRTRTKKAPSASATIFYLKNRAGYRDNPAEESAAYEAAVLAYHVDARDLTADFVEPYRCAHEYFGGGRPGLHTMVLRGGRGGAKSSFAARLAYECMRQNVSANVVFARRFKSDLRSTVFAQFQQIIAAEGDIKSWDVRTSPPRCRYKVTGCSAYFVGLDNPELLKSFVPDKGYVKLLVFEEADELGLREMESAADTMMRANGVEDARQLQVRVFNPPPSASNPMNEWCAEHAQDAGVEVYESSYLHVPRQWLGEQFFERAEWFREHQPEYYRNNYLGEVTGTGGEIFANVRDVELTDEAVMQMDESGSTYQGLDFGYEHPMAFVRVHYDRETRTVTPTFEQVQRHASMGDFLRGVEAWRGQEVICDSAEPDRIADMREAGWDAVGAVKRWGTGKGRAYSWDWLRQRYRIRVDGRRTPELAHELRTLEFARTKDGHYSSRYPDVGEDAVMALIYALNRVIRDEE